MEPPQRPIRSTSLDLTISMLMVDVTSELSALNGTYSFTKATSFCAVVVRKVKLGQMDFSAPIPRLLLLFWGHWKPNIFKIVRTRPVAQT